MDLAKVEESAKATEEKAAKIMKTYFGEELDTSEALEFLCLAEGGEVAHYEVLQGICSNFDNKKTKFGKIHPKKRTKASPSMY